MKNFLALKIAVIAIQIIVAILAEYSEQKKQDEIKTYYIEKTQNEAPIIVSSLN